MVIGFGMGYIWWIYKQWLNFSLTSRGSTNHNHVINLPHRVGKLSKMEVVIKITNSGKPAVISLRLFDMVCSDD